VVRPSLRVEAGPGGAPSSADDVDLVERARLGDPEGFRGLVQRHQGRLYRYALRMSGDEDTAMDLVQAALIRAHDRLRQCRDPSKFGNWVLAILCNGCRHHLRRGRTRLPLAASPLESLTSIESPARDLERQDLRAALSRALAVLPAEQREAFLLRHMEGMSYEDMVPVTRVSASALRQRVHRAREELSRLLKEIV